MTYIDRSKFTTENGRKLYDALKKIEPHEDWSYLMLMLAKGDDQRELLLNFIGSGKRTVKEISRFVIDNWGQ